MHNVHSADTIGNETQIETVIRTCLETERTRGIASRSLKELKRYLSDFAEHCKRSGKSLISGLTPEFLKNYVINRQGRGGPTLGKAIVWSLRKLGAYLALSQFLPQNPAKDLHHPKMSPRAKLPEYLSTRQLRHLLEAATSNRTMRDFTILSLLATTGLRPHEIASLTQEDIDLNQQRIDLQVKGGWVKKTPLSAQMADVLETYLADRCDNSPAAFINTRGRPISVRWIQRMVRDAGGDTELPFSLTCWGISEYLFLASPFSD